MVIIGLLLYWDDLLNRSRCIIDLHHLLQVTIVACLVATVVVGNDGLLINGHNCSQRAIQTVVDRDGV